MKTLLSVVLFIQIFNVSKDYFNYEKIIKIDIKSNSDNNLVINILSDILPEKTHSQQLNTYWMKIPCWISRKPPHASFVCNPKGKHDIKHLYFLDCLGQNQMMAKYLFRTQIIEDYLREFKIKISVYGQELYFNSTKHIHAYGYDITNYNPMDCALKLKLFTMVEFDELANIPNKKESDNFFTMSIFKEKHIASDDYSLILFSDILLSDQNSLRSYNVYKKSNLLDTVDQKILVQKISHYYLKAPHGNCHEYDDKTQKYFNSSNQWQCYRRCLKNHGKQEFNCNPVFIEYTIHELDFTSSDLQIDCNSSFQQMFDKYVNKNDLKTRCEKFCPKDCQRNDFKMKTIRISSYYESHNQSTHYTKSLVWDSTQPMFAYYEEPIMSFIDYLVHCGGLFGLWFGTSAQDVIHFLINHRFWSYIWHKVIDYNNRIIPIN